MVPPLLPSFHAVSLWHIRCIRQLFSLSLALSLSLNSLLFLFSSQPVSREAKRQGYIDTPPGCFCLIACRLYTNFPSITPRTTDPRRRIAAQPTEAANLSLALLQPSLSRLLSENLRFLLYFQLFLSAVHRVCVLPSV